MSAKQFPRPVSVLVGLGFPRRIDTPLEAYMFLSAAPGLLHDEAFEATMATCQMALAGTATVEEANDIFAGYARRCGLYVEEIPVEVTAHDLSDLAA